MKRLFLFLLTSLILLSSAVCVFSEGDFSPNCKPEHITVKISNFDPAVKEVDLNAHFPESDTAFYTYELDPADVSDTVELSNSILRISYEGPVKKIIKIKATDKNKDVLFKTFTFNFIHTPSYLTSILLTITILLLVLLIICILAVAFSGPRNVKLHIRYIRDGKPCDNAPGKVRLKRFGPLWLLTGCGDTSGIFITRRKFNFITFKKIKITPLLKYIPKKEVLADNGKKVYSTKIYPLTETEFSVCDKGDTRKNGINVFFYAK